MSAQEALPISAEEQQFLDEALKLDASDPLAFIRDRFYLPDGIYLDGNSLGAMSHQEDFRLSQYKQARKTLGIRAWTQGDLPWWGLNKQLKERMAPFVGCNSGEISIMPTVSNAITQAVSVIYDPDVERNGVLFDAHAFPTDARAVAAYMKDHKLDPKMHMFTVPPHGEITEEQDIIDTMQRLKDRVSLIVWPTVDYKTGQLYDTALITEEAHKRGIKVLFDASHSFSIVPHQVSSEDADAYVWTDYKWANGSPGTVAGMYIHPKYQKEEGVQGGWWATIEEEQFAMDPNSELAPDGRRFEGGTLSVPAQVSFLGALEAFEGVDVGMLREKSLIQTEFLIRMINTLLPNQGFYIPTPREPNRRGGHVALAHENPTVANQVNEALKEHGVTPDFRPPNYIRLAPACYNSYRELFEFVRIARKIMDSGEYKTKAREPNVVA